MAIVEEVTEVTNPMEEATKKRKEGNELFAKGQFEECIEKYKEAMESCPAVGAETERSLVMSNMSAAYIKLERWEDSVDSATKAIEFGAVNEKALERRAHAYKKMQKYSEAIDDLKEIKEKYPSRTDVTEKIAELEAAQRAAAEKMKEEVVDKLKSLGDMCLRPFGLSTDSFELVDNGQGGMTISMKPKK